MSVLIYDNSVTGFSKCLESAIAAGIPRTQIDSFNDMSDFTRRLRQPGTNSDIVIFFADTRSSLDKLIELYSLLHDVRIIIVLLDRSSDTIWKAHSLTPRLLTFANGKIEDLVEVVLTMFNR